MADISRTVKNVTKAKKVLVKTASFSAKASESRGTYYLNSTTAITATLPKVTKQNDGVEFTFVLGALAGSGDHKVTPATGNTIYFAAAGTASATVDHSLVFTNATDNVGQYFRVVASYDLAGWVPTGYGTTASLAKA